MSSNKSLYGNHGYNESTNRWLFSQEGGKVRASVFLPCESSRDARLRRFMAELRAAIPALSNPEDEVVAEELAGTGT